MIKGRRVGINNSLKINFMLSGFICMYHSMNHKQITWDGPKLIVIVSPQKI